MSQFTGSRPLKVITNSFEITRLPTKSYIQYDAINPEIKNSRRSQEIVERLQLQEPAIFTPRAVYDGKSILYSSHALSLPGGGGSATFTVYMGDRTSEDGGPPRRGLLVRLTRVAGQTVDFKALNDLITSRTNKQTAQTATATNVLQFLIRQAPNLKYPHTARAYFTSAGSERIRGGLTLWRGFFQSVRPTIGRMLVNVDISMSAMYLSEPVMDVALDVLMLNKGDMRVLNVTANDPKFRRLNRFFKRVLITVPRVPKQANRKKAVHALVPHAGRYEFEINGQPTTVQAHYLSTHNIPLRYPDAFGVLIKNKSFNMVIPAELCHVAPGQRYKGKVPESLTASVVRFATKRPEERLKTITSSVANTDFKSPVLEYANSDFIRDAGMVISQRPMTIDGRLLTPPGLLYGQNQTVRPENGGWNMMGKKFSKPANILAWAIVDYGLDISNRESNARRLASALLDCFDKLGMTVSNQYWYQSGGSGPGTVFNDLRTAGMQSLQAPNVVKEGPNAPKRPGLIIVILPPTAADLRTAVKHFGDVQMGIPTQCIKEDKLRKLNNQYCNNVALKINARLGGENSIPQSPIMREIGGKPFMVVGADVGHPGAGVNNQPSIASLVWSHDPNAVQYVAFSRVQNPREEIIRDLQTMMKNAINQFGEKHRHPPARIFFFRDGVSEGEFDKVEEAEIKAIRAAINELWAEKGVTVAKPTLTFIIVGKRHHIRFFPINRGEGDGKSGNCPAGFVADEGLRSPVALDFYLQSHGGLLGTSRPSHYVVLLDENFGGAREKLQEFAFMLCHSYARATRSVSIPAPVYYADIVCARAKFHFDPNLHYESENLTASSDEDHFDLQRWEKGYKPLNSAIDKLMYFM